MLYIEKKNITRNETPTMTNTPVLSVCLVVGGLSCLIYINYQNQLFHKQYLHLITLLFSWALYKMERFVYGFSSSHDWTIRLPRCASRVGIFTFVFLSGCLPRHLRSHAVFSFCVHGLLVLGIRLRLEERRSSILFTSLLSLFSPNYRLARTQGVYTCNRHEVLHTGSRP